MDLKNNIEVIKGFVTKYKKIIIMVVVAFVDYSGEMLLDVSGAKSRLKCFCPRRPKHQAYQKLKAAWSLWADEYANYLQKQMEDLLQPLKVLESESSGIRG